MNSEEKIIEMVATVYRTCDITDVPIDCQGIIETLGYDMIPYSHLPRSKRQACRKISEDAFTTGGTIYYNDAEAFYTRIRFSMMHELGHLLLGHSADDSFREQEADTFASWMLVPRVDLELCSAMDVSAIAGRYDISLAAARYVINSYEKWHSISRSGLSRAETALAEQLSIEEKKALKKAHEARMRCFTSVREPDPFHSPWVRHKALRLEPFHPNSRSLKRQIKELADHRDYLKGLSERYGVDFAEIMMEQARVDHYYGHTI